MPNSHFPSNPKIGLILTGLLLGLLAACGDNTATSQPAIGGQVPPNTVASQPTNTTAPKPTATIAPRLTDTPSPTTATLAPVIKTVDPNQPVPTPTTFPTGQPVAGDIPNFGTTIDVHGQVNNAGARQKFLEAYRQGKPGQWEYVLFTTEGDPLSHRFVYRGNGPQVTLLVDNTQDKFAGQNNRKVEEYTCPALTISDKTLDVQGCLDSKGQQGFFISLPIA